MPTGYTAPIEDKPGYTFEEYLWNCLRAFDIACRESDGPVRIERQPDIDYYVNSLAESRAELAELESLTDVALAAKIDADYVRRVEEHERWRIQNREEWGRYGAMRAKCEAWMPPPGSGELGKNLKVFMLDQIRISLLAQREEDMTPPMKQPADLYRLNMAEVLRRRIADGEARVAVQVENAKKMNTWLKAIHESVPRPER